MASGEPLLNSKGSDEAAMVPHHSSHQHWRTARVKTLGAVKIKQKLLHLHSLARNTSLMRNKSEAEKARYVLMIIVVIVVLGAATAMTKSAMFHMTAVGRWDNGHPYKFSYALSLTFVVFLIKLCLVFVHVCYKKEDGDMEAKEGHAVNKRVVADESESDDDDMTVYDRLMPWVLLFGFTTFEMLSGTVASLGLLYGAPTSMFVVFKSSKTIFLAVMSVCILGRKLCGAQWVALLLISLSLGIATIAEGKGEGKGEEAVSLMGPALLLLSELFHATMLVLQEIAVKNYWTDPLALLSASAAFGCVLTGFAAYKAHYVWVALPDGGQRPASDAFDSVIMCMNNAALGLCMLFHLFAHVTSDVSHIIILKHISALARTLCDAVKLILMWVMGKLFWGFGIFPVLAEAWHPGLIGSWLMLPAIGIIIYAMLMFKNATYYPIKLRKHHTHIDIEEDVSMNRDKLITANLDDDFYTAMFRKRQTTGAKARRNPVSLLKAARLLTRKGVPALQRAFSRV